MAKALTKKDIKGLKKRIAELLDEQRRTRIDIINTIDKSSSKLIAAFFLESRKIRKEIGSQSLMLKMLADNLSEIQFDQDTGISSQIEVSVGTEIFGTGAKWTLTIDTGKASYEEILKAIQQAPGIPSKIKEKIKSKLQKSLQPN